jgi:hypothetical protein
MAAMTDKTGLSYNQFRLRDADIRLPVILPSLSAFQAVMVPAIVDSVALTGRQQRQLYLKLALL